MRRVRGRLTVSEKRFKVVLRECCGLEMIGYEEQKVFWKDSSGYGIIADFYVSRHRLVFEIDGSYHDRVDQSERDKKRDEWFKRKNIKVVRIRNEETEDVEYIKGLILRELSCRKFKKISKERGKIESKRREILKKCNRRIEDGIEIIECPAVLEEGRVKVRGKKKNRCKYEPPGTIAGSIIWKG